MSAIQLVRKLFDLPLGSRFRYCDQPAGRTYVLLDRADCGLIADAPNIELALPFQGLYSAAESPEEFRSMVVEFVPVQEVATIAETPSGNTPTTHS